MISSDIGFDFNVCLFTSMAQIVHQPGPIFPCDCDVTGACGAAVLQSEAVCGPDNSECVNLLDDDNADDDNAESDMYESESDCAANSPGRDASRFEGLVAVAETAHTGNRGDVEVFEVADSDDSAQQPNLEPPEVEVDVELNHVVEEERAPAPAPAPARASRAKAPVARVPAPRAHRGGPPSSQWNLSTVWVGNVSFVERRDQAVTCSKDDLPTANFILAS